MDGCPRYCSYNRIIGTLGICFFLIIMEFKCFNNNNLLLFTSRIEPFKKTHLLDYALGIPFIKLYFIFDIYIPILKNHVFEECSKFTYFIKIKFGFYLGIHAFTTRRFQASIYYVSQQQMISLKAIWKQIFHAFGAQRIAFIITSMR